MYAQLTDLFLHNENIGRTCLSVTDNFLNRIIVSKYANDLLIAVQNETTLKGNENYNNNIFITKMTISEIRI